MSITNDFNMKSVVANIKMKNITQFELMMKF